MLWRCRRSERAARCRRKPKAYVRARHAPLPPAARSTRRAAARRRRAAPSTRRAPSSGGARRRPPRSLTRPTRRATRRSFRGHSNCAAAGDLRHTSRRVNNCYMRTKPETNRVINVDTVCVLLLSLTLRLLWHDMSEDLSRGNSARLRDDSRSLVRGGLLTCHAARSEENSPTRAARGSRPSGVSAVPLVSRLVFVGRRRFWHAPRHSPRPDERTRRRRGSRRAASLERRLLVARGAEEGGGQSCSRRRASHHAVVAHTPPPCEALRCATVV